MLKKLVRFSKYYQDDEMKEMRRTCSTHGGNVCFNFWLESMKGETTQDERLILNGS
jgi:hypothetical protein